MPSFAACTGGSPTWTCAAVAADIIAANTASSPGDTIIVAGGTIATLTITIDGRFLIGAGTSTFPTTASSGTVIQAGTITVTKNATYNTRLSGFSFTGAQNKHVITNGNSATGKAFIIDHNYFYTDGTGASKFMEGFVNGGLIHHNVFEAPTNATADLFNIVTSETDWSVAQTMGSLDTTGNRNLYFEDNTFYRLQDMPDGDTGTRLVMRHNKFYDSGVVVHSGAPNDSGQDGGGHRHTELYSNEFHRLDGTQNFNFWLWLRGGTGVFANNSMDPATSGTYGGKPDIHFTVGCSAADGPPDGMTPINGTPLAYPVKYQVGQVTIPAAGVTKAFLIFGNTEIDGTTPYTPAVNLESGPLVGCPDVNQVPPAGTSANYVQSGRDYKLTNDWSWVAYTYPHPLQGGACTPDHLSFIAQPVSANLNASIGVVTVGVYDSGNVLCTAATNSVSVAKNGSATWGTLSGTTPVSAVNGIATFSDLVVITTAGAGSIDMASSGLTGATSNSITISATVNTTPLSIKLLLRLRGH